ncbi:hypothetical protein B0A49_10124 [Cryomyces minteri]|uniref:MIT domain-containing protein n=1 Tax=Cryomyces minteri TaxID=331657 RepID=A0A4U0W5D4_9PEZI|nr:hypothetical protein B0A49_10124 [Cryomyces minteri]
METAPLTLAHSHARSASQEYQKAHVSAAVEEYEAAAGEFANATKSTGDTEALRILKLLEEHQHRLAQIIQSQTVKPAQVVVSPATEHDHIELPATGAVTDSVPSNTPAPRPTTWLRTPSPTALRKVPRDSTYATSIATARGIPSQQRRGQPVSPTISSQNVGGKVFNHTQRSLSPDARARATSGQSQLQQQLRAGSSSTSAGLRRKQRGRDQETRANRVDYEDGFQKFYTNLTHGPFQRLSSILAYAGLPLTSEEAPSDPPSLSFKVEKTSARAGEGPDVDKLFSKAALRAAKEQSGFGAAESFYVVPQSGGTLSYADMVTRPDRQLQGSLSGLGEEIEEFVDAQETASPSSPRRGRTSVSSQSTSANKKTREELELENVALRHLSDKLSKRLQMWEASAQSQSMALQQSMHTLRTPHPASVASGVLEPGLASEPAASGEDQVRQLTEQLMWERREMERLRNENEKQKAVLVRYREKWEELKDSARAKERAKALAREEAETRDEGQ